jgi:hypothetical protein
MSLFQNSVLRQHLRDSKEGKINFNILSRTLLKEFKKKKVTPSLIEQDKWEAYFDSHRTELLDL